MSAGTTGPPDEQRRPSVGQTEKAANQLAGSGAEAILEQLDAIAVAYAHGYDIGYTHGRNDRRTEAEAVRLHTAAAEVVTRLAGIPEAPPPSPHREAERQRLMGRSA